jgi:hypothetical protein
MALPERQPSNEVVVTSPQMADISAAGSVYAAAPCSGMLVRAYSCLGGAVTGADCTWTIEINDVAVVGTATVAHSGSAAGTVDEVVFSAPVFVNKGDTIEWKTAGESSTTATALFSAVLRT